METPSAPKWHGKRHVYRAHTNQILYLLAVSDSTSDDLVDKPVQFSSHTKQKTTREEEEINKREEGGGQTDRPPA
jgi:hypothetical protein